MNGWMGAWLHVCMYVFMFSMHAYDHDPCLWTKCKINGLLLINHSRFFFFVLLFSSSFSSFGIH